MSHLVASAAVRYAGEHTSPLTGPPADAAVWTQDNTSAPEMMSGLAEARLLEALIVASGACHVLEIGTFTGVGTLIMAAALPHDGRVTTIEVDESIAAAARRHIDASPLGRRIRLIVGDARKIIDDLEGPFDLVYIDAGKADYPAYYDAVVPKLAQRGVIVADNMFRDGTALDAGVEDEGTLGIREFARRVQLDERMHNVLVTVGDGVMLAWRHPEERR